MTTPTGHRYTSVAPPVLPGNKGIEDAAAERDQLRREILSTHDHQPLHIAA